MFQARIFMSALSLIFSSALFADPNLTLLYRKVDDAGKSRLILVPTDPSAKIAGQNCTGELRTCRPPLGAIVLTLPDRETKSFDLPERGGILICPSDTDKCTDLRDGSGTALKGQHIEVLLTPEMEKELATYTEALLYGSGLPVRGSAVWRRRKRRSSASATGHY